MSKNFRHRLKNILKESIDDMDWIRDVKTTNLDFNFDGKEYWVDISKIDIEGRKKIANYIKKTIPNYTEFLGGELDGISGVRRKGIIIHCGSDRTDFEPKENLLCYSNSDSYEDDYEIDNPEADIKNSIYIDGQEILDYLSVADDEEELDESLEWSDKDEPFDEKDKSFENDPSWKNDDEWEPNPERSHWKQGDAGGSGGGDVNESNDMDWIKDVKPDPLTVSPDLFFRNDDDMYMTLDSLGHDTTNMEVFTMAELAINYGYRWSEEHEGWYHRDEVSDFMGGNFPKGVRRGIDESDELDWIKGVSDQVPPMSSRKKIDLKDFIIELVKDSDEHMEVLQMLLNLDLFTPSDTYIHETGNNGEGFTPEEYDDFGVTNWLEGAWLENGNSVWSDEPSLAYGEINELLSQVNGHKWVLEDWHTNDYNLEYGTYQDRYIFKNNFDGSYFALDFDGSSYDGIGDNGGYLYQVFPKNVTKLVYESKLIKRILSESNELDWIKDIEGFDLGDIFSIDDVSFDEYNKVTIDTNTENLGTRGDRVIYTLGYEEEWTDYVMDGNEDWYLHELISTGGYPPYHDEDYLDSYEINYLFYRFSDTSVKYFGELLDRLHSIEGDTPTSKDLETMVTNERINDLTSGKISTIGSYDFDDMASESLSIMAKYLSINRWSSLRTHYNQITQENQVWVTYVNNLEQIQVTLPFPYKGSYNVSEILNDKLDGVFNNDWSDWFYGEWDLDGSDSELQDVFDKYLESLEEYITENEEYN